MHKKERISLPALLIFGFFLFGFAMLSCNHQRREEKKTLPLPEDKLVKVLADVHIAEVAGQNTIGPQRDSLEALYYRQIFAIHQVDSADFFRSLAILQKEPERMREIYDRVIALIGKTEVREKERQKKNQR